jgi:cytochrome c biogenesis protein
VLLLVSVAVGHLFGWRGQVVVPVGETFSNTLSLYDSADPGPWVDVEHLPPFSLTLDSMHVTFEQSAAQRGAPREFRGTVTWTDRPGAAAHTGSIAVNHPLGLDGAKVYLLGNGYAPVITVRDSTGRVVYSEPTVFLPQDGSYTSTGVVKVPGAQPEQLGLVGQFLPTLDPASAMPRSIFPDALNPGLLVTALEGDLGLSSGAAQSVYALDTAKMHSLRTADGDTFRAMLQPGQTVQLPDGKGSVTFEKVQRYAALTIRHDPGKGWARGAALAAIRGLALSLFVPRRRVFVRVRDAGDDAGGLGRTLVEVGALARGEDAGLDDELTRLAERLGAQPATTRRSA